VIFSNSAVVANPLAGEGEEGCGELAVLAGCEDALTAAAQGVPQNIRYIAGLPFSDTQKMECSAPLGMEFHHQLDRADCLSCEN